MELLWLVIQFEWTLAKVLGYWLGLISHSLEPISDQLLMNQA